MYYYLTIKLLSIFRGVLISIYLAAFLFVRLCPKYVSFPKYLMHIFPSLIPSFFTQKEYKVVLYSFNSISSISYKKMVLVDLIILPFFCNSIFSLSTPMISVPLICHNILSNTKSPTMNKTMEIIRKSRTKLLLTNAIANRYKLINVINRYCLSKKKLQILLLKLDVQNGVIQGDILIQLYIP